MSGVASSPRHTITYPEHSAEVYSSTAFVLFSPRSLHIQQSYQSVFHRYLGKLRVCRDAPQWIDLQRWWQYSQKACPECAHDNEARRCDHTLLPLQHTVSHSCIHANWRPFTHILKILPSRAMQAQQTAYTVPAHCMRRATLPCFHQNCPDCKALYSQQNLPAAQMAALRVSVTGPLEALHTSSVASLSTHAPTYRMAAQECIRRLPSFAPASISLLTLLCAAQISLSL